MTSELSKYYVFLSDLHPGEAASATVNSNENPFEVIDNIAATALELGFWVEYSPETSLEEIIFRLHTHPLGQTLLQPETYFQNSSFDTLEVAKTTVKN